MLDILFDPLKNLFKVNRVAIDNFIFQLHYRFTATALVMLAIVVSLTQFVGQSIRCNMDDSSKLRYYTTYCWIHSTFILPKKLNGAVGEDIPYPGIGTYTDELEKKYIGYYQFVYFFLLLQAILFYIPHYIWKSWDSERIKMLIQDLNQSSWFREERNLTEGCREEAQILLRNCFRNNLRANNMYAWVYFICEILNCLNVFFQAYLIDIFLGYEFTKYGIEVVQFLYQHPKDRIDPMSRIFPKQAKCTAYNWGGTGTIQKVDILCLLPLNIYNEKIFVFLWFWFIVLFCLSLLVLFYRILVFCCKTTRQLSLHMRARFASDDDVIIVNTKCGVGDWFLLIQLARNIDPANFKVFLGGLASDFKNMKSK
ncbi:innexin inx2-like [Artemia franciscana]|uniref:Innexin n=1 Tax=Artemia franciscana TaxID=6661 RepID=A0AA88IG71_ARTSF|nr:hypothetical protein QYM36_002124 [Artemia franciscana]